MNSLFKLFAASALAVLGFTVGAAAQGTIQITDVTGRKVEIRTPVKRVILGEGRQIYTVAVLDREDPFARVVGWRDDFQKADLDGYTAYKAKYPKLADLPTFGGMKEGTFDVEQAVSLRPDVIIMNLDSKIATEEAGLDKKLEKLGIGLVFVDFREKPFENTEKSLRIFGQLFGREERAEKLIAFRAAEIKRVTDTLSAANPARPKVMLERAAGYSADCCMSFGDENFGRMVKLAGGENIGSQFIPGTFGTLNPEQVVASNPDVVIVTGSNWKLYAPDGAWVGVGPGADEKQARQRLAALMQRPAYRSLAVAKGARVHAIWHQFYDSPYQFVAIQALAKWIHPELFKGLDPDATFRKLHEDFLPVAYQPGYFVSVSATQ